MLEFLKHTVLLLIAIVAAVVLTFSLRGWRSGYLRTIENPLGGTQTEWIRDVDDYVCVNHDGWLHITKFSPSGNVSGGVTTASVMNFPWWPIALASAAVLVADLGWLIRRRRVRLSRGFEVTPAT